MAHRAGSYVTFGERYFLLLKFDFLFLLFHFSMISGFQSTKLRTSNDRIFAIIIHIQL